MSTVPSERASGATLEIRDLQVAFATQGGMVPAVNGVSLTLLQGETLAIVGESGSGKTTTALSVIKLLPGSAQITGGSILFDGVDLTTLSEKELEKVRGKQIGFVPQDPMSNLNPVWRIGFQVEETLVANGKATRGKDARAKAIAVLEQAGLSDAAQRMRQYPHQFSGGMRQRVLIGIGLSSTPKLLIADEPTSALDVTVQRVILDHLAKLTAESGTSVLFITHDLGLAAERAQKLVVMYKGRVVEAGPSVELLQNPQHPYTKSLLAAVPHLGTGVLRVADRNAAPGASKKLPVLSFEDVAIDYPKRGRIPAFRAAEHINLAIYPGEILGLVGESGSGKTTLGRAAVGLIPIAEGKLTVVGQDITNASNRDLRPLRRRTGIVFQDPGSSLNPRMPIGESIGEPLLLAGQAKGRELDHRVEQLLSQVELPMSYRNRYPHELSGGQRQRVGIARALALTPELLVADEPTSALDVSVQARFLDLLQDLQAQLGFACLFVSHDLAVVDILAHRIAVMHRGRIVEQGMRDEILRTPKDPYTQRLLAAVPLPDPLLQRERRESRAATRAEERKNGTEL